jgi:tRNA(Ile2) C34 agmatinyltransferase TiaS
MVLRNKKCGRCGKEMNSVHHRTKHCDECKLAIRKETNDSYLELVRQRSTNYKSMSPEEQITTLQEASLEILKEMKERGESN